VEAVRARPPRDRPGDARRRGPVERFPRRQRWLCVRLPEAFRASLAGATRIANPGCYPTAATLSLLPALEAHWLAGPVTVTALSGVSGAGRTPSLRTSFVELDGGAAFYKVGEVHQHVPEMARNFGRVTGEDMPVAFAPQLAPMSRGILLTCVAPLARPVTTEEAHAGVCRAVRERAVRARARAGHLARDPDGEGLQPVRPGGDHGARPSHAARDRGHRQPGEGCGRARRSRT
jgi:hypothetical protein